MISLSRKFFYVYERTARRILGDPLTLMCIRESFLPTFIPTFIPFSL